MRATFHRYITAAAAEFGGSCNIQEGSCQGSLELGGLTLQAGLLENSGLLLLQSCVGMLPREGRAECCRMLLSANGDFSAVGAFTLGVDDEQESITLQTFRVLADTDEEEFIRVLEDMLKLSAVWLEKLDSWRPSAAESLSAGDMDLLQHMLRV